jgi:hypothetical protein
MPDKDGMYPKLTKEEGEALNRNTDLEQVASFLEKLAQRVRKREVHSFAASWTGSTSIHLFVNPRPDQQPLNQLQDFDPEMSDPTSPKAVRGREAGQLRDAFYKRLNKRFENYGGSVQPLQNFLKEHQPIFFKKLQDEMLRGDSEAAKYVEGMEPSLDPLREQVKRLEGLWEQAAVMWEQEEGAPKVSTTNPLH